MGGFTAVRNHLYNLFPRVFRRQLDARTPFCLVIIDLMQFLAGRVKGDVGEISNVTRAMRTVVENYMESREYEATRAVVALFDTAKNVPTNKARTQQKRQQPQQRSIILDEAQYDVISSTHKETITALGGFLACQLDGDLLWRSNNTKFQLYCAITDELLKIVPPRHGLQLIIDDGVSIHPNLYKQRREEMITHHFFKNQTAYAQECLVSSLARHHFTERFIVSATDSLQRLPQTEVGEADIKIPRFLVNGNNTKRYMVVSQDTDIIFVLLLHMKSLLGGGDDDGGIEVWLDTQTPSDRSAGISSVHRFINVKALYYAIIALFATEYPSINNPVETLIFLVYTLETDFTRGFETCLHITHRVVWNTFAALHTAPEILKERGYLLFNDTVYDEMSTTKSKNEEKGGMKRSVERHSAYPQKWWTILANVVQYSHDAVSDHYEVQIDDVKAQAFLYLCCQTRILKDLAALGYNQFEANKGSSFHRTYIESCDELFVWTDEIECKLDAYRQTLNDCKKRKADQEIVQQDTLLKKMKPTKEKELLKKPIVYNLVRMDKHINIDQVIDDIVADDDNLRPVVVATMPRIVTMMKPSITKKMDALVKENVPKNYGIPCLQAMIARIYRTQWLMNYHQNGWKTPVYMTNFADVHPDEPSLSSHGWKAEEIPQTEESISRGDFNSSYYTSVYQIGIEPGVIPFKLYKMVETDYIYNKNHLAYLNFGV